MTSRSPIAFANVVLHSVTHLRKPMDLPPWLIANRIDTPGIARICNDVMAAKTRLLRAKRKCNTTLAMLRCR